MSQSIVIGSDHAGFALKEKLKQHLQGAASPWRTSARTPRSSVDYPTIAHELAEAVADGRFERGVLVCGTGHRRLDRRQPPPGVRAALVHDETTARLSREHNDANVLALGGRSHRPRAGAAHPRHLARDAASRAGATARRVALIEETAGQAEVK